MQVILIQQEAFDALQRIEMLLCLMQFHGVKVAQCKLFFCYILQLSIVAMQCH